jgi:hypothetical protein
MGLGKVGLSRHCIHDNIEGVTITQMFQVVVDRLTLSRLCIVLAGEATNSQQEVFALNSSHCMTKTQLWCHNLDFGQCHVLGARNPSSPW